MQICSDSPSLSLFAGLPRNSLAQAVHPPSPKLRARQPAEAPSPQTPPARLQPIVTRACSPLRHRCPHLERRLPFPVSAPPSSTRLVHHPSRTSHPFPPPPTPFPSCQSTGQPTITAHGPFSATTSKRICCWHSAAFDNNLDDSQSRANSIPRKTPPPAPNHLLPPAHHASTCTIPYGPSPRLSHLQCHRRPSPRGMPRRP